MVNKENIKNLSQRFRRYYPVVIDIETSGFDEKTNALLEIAAVTLQMDDDGGLHPNETLHFHVNPFEGAILEKDALLFNGIDLNNPFRGAVSEFNALKAIFKVVRKRIKVEGCTRAVVVAHNATFDHRFIMAAAARTKLSRLKDNPFHSFVTFDTAALSALVLGQTVLAKACLEAGIDFDSSRAHSALYDTEQTAKLFCELVNRWKRLGGWPL